MEVPDQLSGKMPFIRKMMIKVQGTIYEEKWKRIYRLISSGK
jgi:hypothetical protein